MTVPAAPCRPREHRTVAQRLGSVESIDEQDFRGGSPPTTSPAGTEPAPSAGSIEPGWHADPFGRHQQRWWTGDAWGEKVRDGRTRAIDPPGIDTKPAVGDIDDPEPAEPILDAALPIRPPSPWGQLSYAFGALVIVGLITLVVLIATGVVS